MSGASSPEQHPQQRRLAGAVRADEADAIAAHDARREVLRPPAVPSYAFEIPLGLEHQLARLLGLLDLQPHVADLLAPRRALRAHRLSARTRPSFRVRRALIPWRSHASSSASFLSNFSCWTASLASDFFLPPQVGRVVAGPRRQPAAIELDDARREPLEERAVVGDEHDRAVVVGEEALRAR